MNTLDPNFQTKCPRDSTYMSSGAPAPRRLPTSIAPEYGCVLDVFATLGVLTRFIINDDGEPMISTLEK